VWTPLPVTIRTQGVQTYGMGLGWGVIEVSGHRCASVNGGGASHYVRYLDDHLTVVVLSNCHGTSTDRIVNEILGRYAPQMRK
jgi:hypothetical protein